MVRVTPPFTSRKVLNIAYKAAQETLLATPETLPTAEPATPQIGFTVAEADLPTFDQSVYSRKWVALIYGAGKFVTAGTLYWRIKKNGASVATGSASVSANYYYTVNAYFFDIAVGDLLELALWSSVTDSNWDYKAYQVQVSRIILMKRPRLLVPCNFSSIGTQPALTLGSPSVYTTGTLYPYHADIALPAITAATNYPSLQVGDAFGMFRVCYGDSIPNSGRVATSSLYRPRYYQNYVPSQIIMRGYKID